MGFSPSSDSLTTQTLNLLKTWRTRSLSTEAVTLPAAVYFSPEIYRLEQQKVFGKYWYYVGHLSQLGEPGSYLTVEIAEQPLVILRNKTGELRGFYNICPHRAGPLVLGEGQCHKLTCLYHAWSFDLEGNLRGVPDMEAAENFDMAAHGLKALQVDTWGAFVFVNLDPHAPPLATQLGELPGLFHRYRLSRWGQGSQYGLLAGRQLETACGKHSRKLSRT